MNEINTSVEQKELIEFEQYYIYLYSRNGSYICNTEIKNLIKNNEEKNSNNYTKIITNLIKTICSLDFKKNKKNEGIYYNSFIFKNIKIISINIPKTDLVAVGIFTKEMNSGLIRLFLLNMIISYINYQGDKKDYFKSQNFKNINSIDKINFSNFNNYMYSKIYDTFLSIPLQIHFWKYAQRVFKKRTLYIKDIYYKNYYLIDIKKRKIILNGKSLQNNNNNDIGDCDINISRNKKIWKELIFYCKNLKKDYTKKNDTNFNIMDYKNFFVKIEYKSTYPRRTFIIKFLPLLNGMCIIHEYIQLKLPTFDKDETKKKYKERNIIYGYDSTDKIFRNTSVNFFENENDILKQIHFFIIESLFCSNFSINNFFYLDKRDKIYFSEEILDIIKEELFEFIENNKKIYSNLTSSNHSFYSTKIIKQILNILYEEFIQINNKEKILHKSSSALPLNSVKSILTIKSINIDNNNFLLQITKEEALTYLFNSIKFNKNINPNDITIDLNDENGKRDSISRISDLIERNSGPNIRFSDLLSEKTIKPKNSQIKNKFMNNNNINNIPFPPDSDDNDFKSNGGYTSYNIIKKKIKQKKNNKLKNIINNKNIKNKINNSGENSLQRCLIDEIIPNINNENGKIKVSNQKLIK